MGANKAINPFILDRTHRLQRVLEICRNLSANLEFEPLLNSIIEVASELTSSESSSILVYDKENRFLRFIAAPFYLMEKLKNICVPLDNSIAGLVFSGQKPISLHHADDDDRIFRIVDRELTEDTRSILALPMVFKGDVIGVLEAVNKADNEHYTEEDVTILETLAAQAAVVIQNRQLLEDAQAAYRKAVELDRMKSDFLAITSHELRTPLGLVIGHAAFLEEGASEEQKKHIQIIENSALRLKEIIEELSDESNIRRGFTSLRRRKVTVPLLIQQVVDSFQAFAKEQQVSLSIEISEGELNFEGDADKIGIAISNLVKNAITFTNEGGKVKVKAEEVPGFIKISVLDNGIGIPAEEQGKIFQRFYQVEKHLTRRHGGMGLGLAISKEMIEMHGGKILVESVEGKGSRFMVLLPLNPAQEKAAQRVFLA